MLQGLAKAIAIATITTIFAACGSEGVDGASCSVEQRDDGAYLTCDDGTSAMVDDGRNGTRGTQGGRLADKWRCMGVLDIGYGYIHEVATTEAGDVYASATIADGSVSYSNTMYWLAGTAGAAAGTVLIFLDSYGAGNTGSWWFNLDRASGRVTLSYDDSELPDGAAYLQPTDDCSYYVAQQE